MKTIRYLLFGMLLSHGAIGQIIAPQTVNSTGGSNRKGNLRLDWSVGEMALVNTLSAPDGGNMITNGVIQPQTGVAKSSNNRNVDFIKNEIRILPNPTRGVLDVSINMKQPGQTMLRLYDELGRLRYATTVATDRYQQIERIDMTTFLRGNYMLHVEFAAAYGAGRREGYYTIVKID